MIGIGSSDKLVPRMGHRILASQGSVSVLENKFEMKWDV